MTITSEFEQVANGTVSDHPSAVPSGADPAPVTGMVSGPRLPRREVWLDLPQEAYPGFKIKVWVNYPRKLNDELSSRDQARMQSALRQMVVEHNNWCDSEGAPFPVANSDAFWEALPDELAAAIIVLLSAEVGKLAASLTARNTR